MSDDGRDALTLIAFIGSVFSPYYAWSGWADPENHCAVNVALYGGRRSLWAMTERPRAALSRDSDTLQIGPSAQRSDGSALVIDVNEVTCPLPSRLRGRVRVEPRAMPNENFVLDAAGRHHWRPLAPRARVTFKMASPALNWSGEGYLDHNTGSKPLEEGFKFWTWSRGAAGGGASVLYDAQRRDGIDLSLALRFDASGRCLRETRSDDGAAQVLRTFEDAPFYSRTLIRAPLFGKLTDSVNESLDLDRFAKTLVRMMLPFRMPRRLKTA